jgi:hypothetical protein
MTLIVSMNTNSIQENTIRQKRKKTIYTYYNTDEPLKHYAKWRMLYIKDHKLCDSVYTKISGTGKPTEAELKESFPKCGAWAGNWLQGSTRELFEVKEKF